MGYAAPLLAPGRVRGRRGPSQDLHGAFHGTVQIQYYSSAILDWIAGVSVICFGGIVIGPRVAKIYLRRVHGDLVGARLVSAPARSAQNLICSAFTYLGLP